MEMSPTKASLRARAKKNRRHLLVDSGRICEGLRRFEMSVGAGWIVLYDALLGEPDVSALVELCPARRFAITRTPPAGYVLSVHPFDAPREVHSRGYSQSTADAPPVPWGDVAAVLVPGLAFDRHGGRLGFGAGYYDRMLTNFGSHVLRIGVSDGFIVDRIPQDDHDVAMTHLATEAGVVPLPFSNDEATGELRPSRAR